MTQIETDRIPGQNDPNWWRSAVTYQIYIRSFADYRNIEPVFGTLEDGRALIAEAHTAGLRVLLDIVPNHTSDEHAWFKAALGSPPGSAERARFIFRPGRGEHGEQPPNDWVSEFGGTAWSRIDEPDGEWYLHLFDVKQPDLNWDNQQVRDELIDVLRFWFDAGADGFRIDVAHGLLKAEGLPDLGDGAKPRLGQPPVPGHPHWDRPGVPDLYRAWRDLANSYDPPRVFVAEAWVSSVARLAQYLQPENLHTAFDFHTTRCRWDAGELREAITTSMAAHQVVGAPVTWVLSNHDIDRHVNRYGRGPTSHPLHGKPDDPVDLPLGTRRARAAILLELALPGAVYLYQGEELGLPQVDDIPESMLADPVWERSGHTRRGRDGCRVPLPWTRSGPSFGFGEGVPWLPQPSNWSELSVEAEDGDHASMLWLYRDALRTRHEVSELHSEQFTWMESADDVIAFTRGDGFACVVNFGSESIELPEGAVLLSSVALEDGRLTADAGVWIKLD